MSAMLDAGYTASMVYIDEAVSLAGELDSELRRLEELHLPTSLHLLRNRISSELCQPARQLCDGIMRSRPSSSPAAARDGSGLAPATYSRFSGLHLQAWQCAQRATTLTDVLEELSGGSEALNAYHEEAEEIPDDQPAKQRNSEFEDDLHSLQCAWAYLRVTQRQLNELAAALQHAATCILEFEMELGRYRRLKRG